MITSSRQRYFSMLLALICIHHQTSTSAFSIISQTSIRTTLSPSCKRIICHAKLNKIAANFNLDEILSNEKELNTFNEQEVLSSMPKNRKGNKRNAKKDLKKKLMKEQMKQQKLEKQQMKKKEKLALSSNDYSNFDSSSADDMNIEDLIESVDFDLHEVEPSSNMNGKRIDAALVELLNEESDSSDSSQVAISRSQCGTLLSNECIFVVSPENATVFKTAWQDHNIEQSADGDDGETNTLLQIILKKYGSPIDRKSHILEPSSILVYPTRDSLLSTSAALLSNFIPPTEIIAQKIPLDILFEDEHMIVLNKRAGMVV